MFQTTNWHLRRADGILMPSLRKYSSLAETQMRKFVFILSIFLSVLFVSCVSSTSKSAEDKNKVEDLTLISYNFITDTNLIKSLVKNKISPLGLPFKANDLLNRFARITLKNNTNDTIYFSSNHSNIPSPIDSVILGYCPVTSYSLDSIIWESPSGVRDYFPTFKEAVFRNQTVERFLHVEPFENAKYFEISLHYLSSDTVRTKLIILKK